MGTKRKTKSLISTVRRKVGKALHEMKEGTLRSGRGAGRTVKKRKQAIAIGLSEARKAGAKVPKKKKKTKSGSRRAA